jgi:DNA-binding LacI/PurR family transcriptional regulator
MARPSIAERTFGALRHALASGRWPAGTALPPGRRLAAVFGVSHPVIMRAVRRAAAEGLLEVLPRRPTLVRAGTQARAAATRPVGPLKRRLPDLALLAPEETLPITDPFYAGVIRACVNEASRRNLSARLISLPMREQVSVAQSLSARGCRAAVGIGFSTAYATALSALMESGFPVLLFNRRIPGLRVPTVRMDDYQAAQLLLDRLAALGHRNVCMVTHYLSESAPDRHNLVSGWAEGLERLGLSRSCSMPLYVLPWHPAVRHSPWLAENLLGHRERPTAIVFVRPLWTQLLRQVRARRIAVPRDLSLAIFYPGQQALPLRGLPPLASLDIDYRRAAECVLDLTEKMLGGNITPPSIRVPLDMRMTDSLGPCPVAQSRKGDVPRRHGPCSQPAR